MKYQPRYLAYCAANGLEPEEMLGKDRERYPGGYMTGFLLWIPQMWKKWDELTGRGDLSLPKSRKDHRDFTRWLTEYVGMSGNSSEATKGESA